MLVHSVAGPIDSADLGFTLMHEHVFVFWPPTHQQYPELFDRERELASAIEKLKRAKEAGVQTIVDLTPIDLGRDVTLIRDAAMGADINIVAPTGLYYGTPSYFRFRPREEIRDFFIRDITIGVSTTGIRAGVLKCATEPELDRINERVLRATAQAHRATGVPICTHTSAPNRTGLDQQRIFREEGVDLARTVIGHSDDSGDLDYLEEIIENGSFCGMDRIGLNHPRTTEQRLDMVAELVRRGYADRITLSHDSSAYIETVPDSVREGLPDWQYCFIPTRGVQMLRERGVSQDAIDQMTVVNPRCIFEQHGSY